MAGWDNEPLFEVIIGASGSGKSHYLKERLAELNPPRLLVWDARAEYGHLARHVDSLRAVLDACRSGKPFRLAYLPRDFDRLQEEFSALCRIAFAAGNLALVAEELSDVTKPSWAPPDWRRISTQGRHRGIFAFGTSQRPALIDKTIFGNATHVRCGVLGYPDDAKVMGRALAVRPDVLEQVQGHDWIKRDVRARTNTASRPEILGQTVAVPVPEVKKPSPRRNNPQKKSAR